MQGLIFPMFIPGYCRFFCLLSVPMMVMLLTGCVTVGDKPLSPGTIQDALYDRLDQASKDYEIAWRHGHANPTDAIEEKTRVILNRLRNVAVHCHSVESCNPQRILSVYDRLLRLKSGLLMGDESPDDDNTIADESVDGINNAVKFSSTQRQVVFLHGQKMSELIAMNAPVKAALERWLTEWRPRLMDSYVNYRYLRHSMWPRYKKGNLPEALLFGILADESRGKVNALSRSGAAGPFQFMYATGLRFGLGEVNGFDTRFDASCAARASAAYINEQLDTFQGNLGLTLAAYNAGENRMRRLVGKNTTLSFYNPRIYNQLSRETRDYVPAVLAAAWLFLHPHSYNLHFPAINGVPGHVTLRRPASITELAVCLGDATDMPDGWFRTLRNLNPRLGVNQRQPVGMVLQVPRELERVYASRCVDGPWPILASDLHNAAAPLRHQSRKKRISRYTVRQGDTLSEIVHHHRCTSVRSIRRLNGIRRNNLIRVGQVLKLPVSCHQ